MFDEVVNISIIDGDGNINVIVLDFEIFLEWKYVLGFMYIVLGDYLVNVDVIYIDC